MTNDRLEDAESIFQIAADLPPAERDSFLAERCRDDAPLHALVHRLLRHHDGGMPRFLETPPSAPGILAGGGVGNPAQVGPYEIIRKLGEGGMATVFEARQSNPDRVVALKVIKGSRGDHELIRRFRFETRMLGQFSHPGVARVYEAGETAEGIPYFAGELVRGLPMTEYAQQKGLDYAGRLELMARVCDAVQHAHDAGVLHRDLKPANILVTDEEGTQAQPKVLDFGVARALRAELQTVSPHTEMGQMVGTLAYMSPEQIAGDPDDLDVRSDVYQLGVVLYELLAGKRPFAVTDLPLPKAGRVILEDDPPLLRTVDTRLRGDVEAIVGKAMSKEKERRYASAAALAEDIRRYLNHEPIRAHPSGGFYRLRKLARRRRDAFIGVAAALVVTILAVIALVIQRGDRVGGPGAEAVRQLTFGGDVLAGDLAPDGPLEAHVSETGSLVYLYLDTGVEDAAPVTFESSGDSAFFIGELRWSPKGQEIAIIVLPRPGALTRSTYIVARGAHEAVAAGPEGFAGVAWSPDGGRIAGIRTPPTAHALSVLDLASGQVRDVPLDGSTAPVQVLAWSDQDLLYYRDAAGDSVHVVPLTGGHPLGILSWSPIRCAPGQEAIYYYADHEVRCAPVDSRGRPLHGYRILADRILGIPASLSVTQDGRRVLYDTGGQQEVWLCERDTATTIGADFRWSRISRGTMSAVSPRFSPDGSRIAMAANPLGVSPSRVLIHSLADASQITIAQDSVINSLDWSPDGSEIVYNTGRGMARVGVGDGLSRPIPGPRDPMYIRWLRDGRIMYLERGRNMFRQYTLLDPETGRMQLLPVDSQRGSLFQFAEAPDFRSLAVAGNRGDQDDIKVWLIDLDDGNERLLYDGWAAPFAWSADGKWIYLITERLPVPPEGPRSRVLRVSADGAIVEDVVDLLAPVFTWGYITMSSDGRRIACTQRRTGRDLWLMDIQPGGD